MISEIATIFFVLISQLGLGASAKDSLAGALEPHVPETEYVVAQGGLEEGEVMSQEVMADLAPLPGKISSDSTISVNAKSSIVIDAATKEVLFDDNADQQLAQASITKITTALVVLDNADMGEVVTATGENELEIGADIDLRAGEQITVGDLLQALLIKSANDAALALAQHVGGSQENFAAMMNDKAKELGLRDSHYMNPHGLDEDGHYSTARDIALIMAKAMENDIFRAICHRKEADIHILNSEDRESIHIVATNKLLIQDDNLIEAGKTGFTDEAGESVVEVGKNPEGHRVVSVILNSPNRFEESRRLINFVFDKYNW